MKIEKSNNPVAVGALILVLVLIAGRIVWMLFGQNRTVSAASPVVSSAPVAVPPAPAIAPAPQAMRPHPAALESTAPGTTPESARNPFTRSVLIPPAPARVTSTTAPRIHGAGGERADPIMPLPPFTVRPWQNGVTVRAGRTSPLPGWDTLPNHGGQSVPAQALSRVSSEANPLLTLKLTAIIDGTVPMAVLQTAHPEPLILHTGDEVEGMRVLAIHENDVLLVRAGKRWTLSLQSAADSSAAGSLSVTSDVASEEETDELQPKP